MEPTARSKKNGVLSPDEQRLTPAERRVLNWLARGYTTREIASRTFRSFHTVGNQTRAILHKLGARNRVEAIAIALERGILFISDSPLDRHP